MTVSFDDTKSMTILAAYDSYMSNDTESIEKLYSEDAHVFVNSGLNYNQRKYEKFSNASRTI